MAKDQTGFRGYFEWFVHSQVAGSILLLSCTVMALIWANSPWQSLYEHLLHIKVGFSWGDAVFRLSLHHWINDGLMVLFFFVDPLLVAESKVGILAASLIAGIIGYYILNRSLPRQPTGEHS
jgi:Na+/H+ antiporter NhaA